MDRRRIGCPPQSRAQLCQRAQCHFADHQESNSQPDSGSVTELDSTPKGFISNYSSSCWGTSTICIHCTRTLHAKNLFSSDMVKLVFKMLELVLKTPKLPCPAFSLQGLGWIPHKKSLIRINIKNKHFSS